MSENYIIEYKNHTQQDFEDVWNIEKDYLEPSTISSVKQTMEWDRKNNDIHIFVRDKKANKIVGEITLLPLSEKQFKSFIKNQLLDTELIPQALLQYEENKEYNLLFSAIAIDKNYRLDKSVLLYLLKGLYNKIANLRKRHICFKNMCAEGQTKDGQKFIQSFLNLKEKNTTKEGYKLYSFDSTKDLYKWIDIFPNYIKRYESSISKGENEN